jgi:methionine salvage enolase-phosphatase E1
MVKLIILDVFGTLIGPLNNIEFRRPKVYEFLDMNPDATVTFYTDAPEIVSKDIIMKGMEDLGILSRLREPFFYGESMDKRYKKHLSKVARKFGFDIEDVVMIGDSQRDIDSAKKYKVKMVVVPDDKVVPVMPMDTIGNLDELLRDHKAARFFHADGEFQHVVGDHYD